MKRLIPLFVLAVVLTIAPAAMADHCFRCPPVTASCTQWPNHGFLSCENTDNGCVVQFPCGDHSAAPTESLASEFTVASVERLDEPKTTAPETAIASLEAPKPATR